MYMNLHTHTKFCNHAEGEMREYVECAIKNGLSVLGFSDHVPQPYNKKGYVSGSRMAISQVGDYVSEILALREEYKDKIKILIGYEAEYYPEIFDNMLRNIKQYPCDYLILGQHSSKNEYDGKSCYLNGFSNEEFTEYTSQMIDALKTNKFTYVAHPDMCTFAGDSEVYEREVTRLCKAAIETNTLLEINLLGLRDNRSYPSREFWKIASRYLNKAVLGCDAHSPGTVASSQNIAQGIAFAKEFNIEIVEKIPIKPV